MLKKTMTDLLQASIALIFVLSLIGVFAYLLKRFNHSKLGNLNFSKNLGRIKIIETFHLSSKTKLYIIQKDNSEFFVMSSESGNTLIDKKDL
jgi:flagellar biogenesis protein FliO